MVDIVQLQPGTCVDLATKKLELRGKLEHRARGTD